MHKMEPKMKTQKQTDTKKDPYIMETIMHETLKVFNRAAGFREAYRIYENTISKCKCCVLLEPNSETHQTQIIYYVH